MESNSNESKPALLPYGTRTLDPAIRIIDQAKEIEQAKDFIQTRVQGKLDLILRQIQYLQEEAKKILMDASIDEELHRIKCNFQKKIGDIYHLYEKDDGEKYFSILSPEEWKTPPHKFCATYRLDYDRSFKQIQ
jgi:hypothetical protein